VTHKVEETEEEDNWAKFEVANDPKSRFDLISDAFADLIEDKKEEPKIQDEKS